jgi:hypothetical protein
VTNVLGISGAAALALVAGAVIGLAFVGALIAAAVRRRGPRGPDIPAGMRPGPADEVLERRHLERVMGWGIVFTLFFAAWLPILWIREPTTNVGDENTLVQRSIDRGNTWFQVASEENPTGFGCAGCHGPQGEGGVTIFQEAEYPVPPLNNVCQRLTIDEPGGIRETIAQGREGTPMPSWSVRFAGPMNDQQILDLINHLVVLNEENVPPEENLCTNPSAALEEEGGTPSPEESPTQPGAPGAGESPTPEEAES